MSTAKCVSRLFDFDEAEFREKFNEAGFLIRHRLADHELFSLSRIVELSQRLPQCKVEYNAGNLSIGQGDSTTPTTGLSIEETIRGIETCNSWMVLKNVEIDEAYGKLLDECLDEVGLLSEPIAPGMCKRMGFVFVSSPGSVTPYHIDHENNFLLQIRGEKHVRMFDRHDREVLSEADIERIFAGGHRNLKFADEFLDRSDAFTLHPGDGLHFPVHAPHFVQNGDNVSISFSITFQTEATERARALYCMNHRLRKLKWSPLPPGASAWADFMKLGAYEAMRRVKRVFGKSM